MFKSKGPIVFLIVTVIMIAIVLALYLTTGTTEWGGHWEFTF